MKKPFADLSIFKNKSINGFEYKEAVFLNKNFPQHFHTTWSVALIKTGSENLYINNVEYSFTANTLIIIPPYISHAHSGKLNSMWEFEAMYFETDFLNDSGIQLPKSINEHIIISTNQIHVLNFQMLSHTFKSSKFNITNFNWFIHTVIKDPQTVLINVIENKHQLEIINDIKIELMKSFCNKITLDELSDKYRVDKYKLLRSFKKATGITPNEYVLALRIERAKYLINDGTSFTHSALDSGFYDQSHFYHYFKKYVGLSPSGYKNKLQYITSLV